MPLSVGVAAQLKPAVEFTMMSEKCAAAIRRKNPGGARNMARAARTLEAVRVGLDQPTDAINHRGLAREGVAVTGQHVKKRLASHPGIVRGLLSVALSGSSSFLATDNEQWTTDNYGNTAFCVEPVRRE